MFTWEAWWGVEGSYFVREFLLEFSLREFWIKIRPSRFSLRGGEGVNLAYLYCALFLLFLDFNWGMADLYFCLVEFKRVTFSPGNKAFPVQYVFSCCSGGHLVVLSEWYRSFSSCINRIIRLVLQFSP